MAACYLGFRRCQNNCRNEGAPARDLPWRTARGAGKTLTMNARITLLALALLVPSAVPSAADPFASDWAPSLKSEARLVADGTGQAGFEVKLAPGAITYWRDPGESGVPPTFDFSGSVNLARAEVGFPAPKRIAEPDGSEAFGYSEGVVFPLLIEAKDRSQPVMLALKANYAVCEKICL